MKTKVLKAFIDKETKQPYSEGGTYESNDSKRVAFLVEKGFLAKVEIAELEVKVEKPKKKTSKK